MIVKFAVAQTNIKLNPEINLESVSRMSKKAKKAGANLVLFPEYFISGPKLTTRERMVSLLGSKLKYKFFDSLPLIERVKEIAKLHQIYIVGSHPEVEGKTLYNTAYLISDKGEIVGEHRKIYLKPVEAEAGFSPGVARKTFNTPFGKVALAICNDCFKVESIELMKEFKKRGAQYILVPIFSLALTPNSLFAIKSRLSVHCFWNNFFILGASSVGKTTPTRSLGHSLIICPVRGILKEGNGKNEQLLVETLDTNILAVRIGVSQKYR